MIEFLQDWWPGLSTIDKIYWAIAIPATLIFVLQTILTFVGGEIDADVDLDAEGEGAFGHQFFSIKNFVAFFTIFGWTGIACTDAGMGVMTSLIISFFSGLLMMVLMASIFYFVSRLTSSGNLDIRNAKGVTGEVYLTIQANRGNIGKVSILVQGSFRELDAITDDEQDLKNGMVINVKEVINGNLLLVSKN